MSARKFKPGDLCIVVANPAHVNECAQHLIGEIVEVVAVSTFWKPIKSAGGLRFDYEIADADNRRYICDEPVLRRKPPKDAPGSMTTLTHLTGWRPTGVSA